MLKTLKKHWGKVSILLIVIILASLFFWPGITRPLGMACMLLVLVMVSAFIVQEQVEAYKQEQFDRVALMRNIAMDLLGLLIALTIISLVVGVVVPMIGGMAGMAAANIWPDWGVAVAILTGLLAGILVGIAVGFAVRLAWGKLTKSSRR